MNRRDLFKGLAAGAVAPLALRGDLTPESAKRSERGHKWMSTDKSGSLFVCSASPFREGETITVERRLLGCFTID